MEIIIENKEIFIPSLIKRLTEALTENYYKRPTTMKYRFEVLPGRKYLKICQGYVDEENVSTGVSVHAFVDKQTGDVYKPAGWHAPAKGIRFNLFRDIEKLEKYADWAGSYLYKR